MWGLLDAQNSSGSAAGESVAILRVVHEAFGCRIPDVWFTLPISMFACHVQPPFPAISPLCSKERRYVAKFKVLSDVMPHHIQEEESHIFPEAEKVVIDFSS
jgi:hypothetical protein